MVGEKSIFPYCSCFLSPPTAGFGQALIFPVKCSLLPVCVMDSMFEDDISILTQDALAQDDEWLDSPNTDLSSEMCSASHFAFITAYDDIKNRLTGLERENTNLKRKLKMYEIKFPLISDFGEERMFPVYESKESSLLKSEKANLQQQLNQFQRELQKSKEREEQMEEMIQAYEKLCVEKTDLESELGQMVGFNYFPGHAF
uniref:TBK1 binding protein 1 n=1 Tax=Laticauda laticaudata TaxID=8630 RepID=A0A8C5RUF7_LATLA